MARKWFGRRSVIILALAVIVLLIVVAILPGFIEGYRSSFQNGLLVGIHDSCVSSATDAARSRRLDVSTPEFARKIEHYCSCVADSVKSGKVTTAELNIFIADPQAVDPSTAKVREIVATCLR
jgi:hypothetical protein